SGGGCPDSPPPGTALVTQPLLLMLLKFAGAEKMSKLATYCPLQPIEMIVLTYFG
uniref:Uncharacterized protein n=1 Tax=Crocodylus porosus TaxID=8502 RepID=A0A7M4DUM6_CROPO